uniref:5'-AMP-activated protein kinase catalytic subunit alpha-2 n=1 Tax=Coccidioides posadasii RMSCC 3488 TaxID=454284 RepID=A0A0J6FQD5_COCPO|nr:5'-AMP-activated protein kinase catalytic subunit alpha-2 [Coccidioides posadasii RMSCC 3488]
MAHTEIVPFEDKKTDTRYSNSPIPVREGNNFDYDGRRTFNPRDAFRHEGGMIHPSMSTQQAESWEEHHPTPPIAVPYPGDKHPDHESYHDGSPYEEHSSSLEDFTRNRRTSISFNPEVTLDCGTHHALDEPLRNLRLRERAAVESPCSGDSSESGENQAGSSHEYHPAARPITSCFVSNIAVHRFAGHGRTTNTPRRASRCLYPDIALLSFVPPAFLGWSGRMVWEIRPWWQSAELTQVDPAAYDFVMGLEDPQPPVANLPPVLFCRCLAVKLGWTDYVLGKTIGYGGFSTVKEVFKVNDDGRTERLAVKIVKKNLVGQSERQNEQFQAEFDHEVRVWRYLNHPNILPLEAVYETDYATFCFTRMTNGGTLFDLVKKHHREGLRMDQAKHYAYQLASAIRYLHEDARVVHRDVKLENCLLHFKDPNDKEALGKLYLCDFGMSEWMMADTSVNAPAPYGDAADRPPPKNIGPSNMSTSIAGGVGGSLEYAAPELIMSKEGVLEPAADIWALGVIVFALVAGSRPFDHSFQPKVQTNIVHGRWDRGAVFKGEQELEQRNDALALIQGCLELDPMRRWTIADVMECRWFDEYVERVEEHIPPQWKY